MVDPAPERDPSDALRVRRAGPLDGPAIATVHVAAIRAFGPETYDDEQVEAWAAAVDPESYPLSRRRSDVQFVVAEAGGEVVGFGCLERNREEITAVYVHPEHARTGVGSAVVDDLEARARDDGVRLLSIVASRNAVAFYDACGYERTNSIEHEAFDGVFLECAVMEKDL